MTYEQQCAFSDLPEFCYAVTPEGFLALIKRGQKGYYPVKTPLGVAPTDYAKQQNSAMGISWAQERAMNGGSLFGWNKPIADPATYGRMAA